MKRKYQSFSVDPTTTQNVNLGEYMETNNVSVQIEWDNLTAASAINISLQLQESISGVDYTDITDFVCSVDDATNSVIFNYDEFLVQYLRLKITSTDCTGGTMNIHIIAD